jgi:transposase
MIAIRERHGKDADHRFAEPPGDEHDLRWREIDQSLPADHLARQISEVVERLDLAGLFATYTGRGSKALWPDLLLKMVLYEMQSGRPSPAAWYRDAMENAPVQWLLFGMRPSRAALYEFRGRAAEFWDDWNEQVLQQAQGLGIPVGQRVALDGSLIAALASRHHLVNQKTLTTRTGQLESALAADQQGSPLADRPGWMAKQPDTCKAQLERYRRAQIRMDQLQAENAKRPSSKRKKPEKIVLNVSEPEATVGRDKCKVFRPLYNVQLMYDLDSALITAYAVFSQQNDAGTMGPMLNRSVELAGGKPQIVLADAGYAGGPDLALCEQAGVTVYAPVSENDFSAVKRQKSKLPQIAKKDFTWLPEKQTYRCPEGHLLAAGRTRPVERSNDRLILETTYRCDSQHCTTCPRRETCTTSAEKGRTISRLEHEDLVEELRARMATAAAKEFYKLRRQTIELRYADLKQHRRLRQFTGYGLRHARAETAGSVLVYNLLVLRKTQKTVQPAFNPVSIPEEVPS